MHDESAGSGALSKAEIVAQEIRAAPGRWIDLVCDGNVVASAAALAQIGELGISPDLMTVLEALPGQVLVADEQDDESVARFFAEIARARGLGAFEAPPGPPFGIERCAALLRAFAGWLVPQGFRLVALDSGADDWCAVVVRAERHAELIDLCDHLGFDHGDPAAPVDD